jgi:glutamate formiminotransferase
VSVLECVVNVSEGADRTVLAALAEAAGSDLLDVHSDADHNRSVFTMVGTEAPRRLARRTVELLDLSRHEGVHPRVGAVDVVPFVPLAPSTWADALAARDDFARFAAGELGVPCFLYGPERTLPDIRKHAFDGLVPDHGPATPHPTAGAMCVGAREILVAYNVWLDGGDVDLAKSIARELRSPSVRALGLLVGEWAQVSMNLIAPDVTGPAAVYDAVAARAPVQRAELVGLAPSRTLASIDRGRWAELDLSPDRTIESRIAGRTIPR